MIHTKQTATKKSRRPSSTAAAQGKATSHNKPNNRNHKNKSVYLDDGKKSALSFMVEHQIDQSWAAKFLFLQHRNVLTGLYHKGWSDLCFISFWIVIFTMLRAVAMRYLFKPIALWRNIHNKHQLTRFQEEGWVCLYYTVSWSFGMYVLYNSDVWDNWFFWFKPEKFFDTYPVTELPHRTIWYYYVQFAFWLQQIFVLHVEAPRKDFWALLAHHTVTLLLISGSIISNFWLVGNAVFVTMDLSDIILAFSKSMKYLKVSDRFCDACFGVFMVSWIYTRHYLYGYILHSFVVLAYEIIPFEFDIWQGKWYCRETAWLPILGLGLLQLLMIYWFAMILKIVVRILKGYSAEDDRSDDEATNNDAEEDAAEAELDEKSFKDAKEASIHSDQKGMVQDASRRLVKDSNDKKLNQALEAVPVSSAMESVKSQ
ncbi:sphingosine N-acyltransferase lag1 [Actinomortierella wolfii]|nr:sphingosine N-acyltransferase lag1 [Actinomortierella wolfii]